MPTCIRTAFACALLTPAFAVLILALAPAASAHMAPTGWMYDNYCCGGQDCQPIPTENVQITPEGYVVSIPNGQHVTASRDHRKLFHYNEVRKSGDENFHGCILPNSQEFRCLYVPEFGA